ncbi:unnamed protein product [Rotaria magnacalcarata]|uniref:Transposase n=1 Tax=Rotaria magnacalcarata TaxID=392030 RepID=A0A8S3AN69_9BILA|nr:unnamed protein product [Rotaria magnacalcarata]
MPREIQLTESEKKLILALHKKNISHREIARKINRPKTVVTAFLNDPLKYDSRKRTGRRKKVDERTKQLIIRTASNQTTACANIVNDLCFKKVTMDNQSSYEKVKHLEKDEKRHCPALTTAHKDLRLSWTKAYMTWNNEWHKVVWSDEKKLIWMVLMAFLTTGMISVKRKRFFSTRPRGGGSVMIWASFGWGGKSSICFVDGPTTAKEYREQDNAPIHRAKVNLIWFKSQKINVLPWPSLSPVLNPIENLWGILARKGYARGKQFRSKEQLKTAILKSWEEIIIEQFRALVESMPERIFEVMKPNGAQTNVGFFLLVFSIFYVVLYLCTIKMEGYSYESSM